MKSGIARAKRRRAAVVFSALVLVAGDAAASGAVALEPLSTIRLSGSAASSVAAAGERLWVTHYESSILSAVDPRLAQETATVALGPLAAGITEIGGRLWIGHYTNRPGDSQLSMVDPARGAVALTVVLPQICCEPAGSLGKVWVVDPRGSLMALDAVSGQVASRTPVTLATDVHVGLMADERAVWVSSDTTPLLKVDPATATVTATIDVGGGIPMTVADGLVWGAGPHHVWAVDSSTGVMQVSFALSDTIEVFSLAVTPDAIWAGVRRPGYVGRVLRLDRSSGALLGEAEVALPAKLLYAYGSVFVVDSDTNSLLRFTP